MKSLLAAAQSLAKDSGLFGYMSAVDVVMIYLALEMFTRETTETSSGLDGTNTITTLQSGNELVGWFALGFVGLHALWLVMVLWIKHKDDVMMQMRKDNHEI